MLRVHKYTAFRYNSVIIDVTAWHKYSHVDVIGCRKSPNTIKVDVCNA